MAVPTLNNLKDALGITFNDRDDALRHYSESLEDWFRRYSTFGAEAEFPTQLEANFTIAFKRYWDTGEFPESAVLALGEYYKICFGGEDEDDAPATAALVTYFGGISADTVIDPTEVTLTSTDGYLTLPDFSGVDQYLIFGVRSTDPDLKYITFGGLNNIGAFTKQTPVFMVNGMAVKLWLSNAAWNAASTSQQTAILDV